MRYQDAKVKAEEVIADMQSMNASSEHPPSKAKAYLAGTVIDLCSQLEAYDDIAKVEARLETLKAEAEAARIAAAAKAAEEAAKHAPAAIIAPEPAVAHSDAHLGGLGGE